MVCHHGNGQSAAMKTVGHVIVGSHGNRVEINRRQTREAAKIGRPHLKTSQRGILK